MKLHNIKDAVAVFAVITLIMAQASCYYPKSSPGWEYMPDMSNAKSFETYSENPFFPDSLTSRLPVTGTIPRGVYEPFHFSSNPTGYDSAGVMLNFPAWLDSNSLVDGHHIFSIYCAVCHGSSGKGDGTIAVNPKLLNPLTGIPSYFDENHINLPPGKMYYSVHYGKNLMGAYSTVLDHNEVWKVVYYVKNMQNHHKDSVATVAAKASAKTTASADTTKK
jgi:mono/diheme cytochrome c family protein